MPERNHNEKMEQISRDTGVLILSLCFLLCIALSTYLLATGLPDAARLFMYPATLSLVYVVIILFGNRGDSNDNWI